MTDEKVVEAEGRANVNLGRILARIASIKVVKRDENGEVIEELEKRFDDGDDR